MGNHAGRKRKINKFVHKLSLEQPVTSPTQVLTMSYIAEFGDPMGYVKLGICLLKHL
jgi:hypothetical protein